MCIFARKQGSNDGKTMQALDSEFKVKVVLESLKSQRTVLKRASHFELHPNQISDWKKEATNVYASYFYEYLSQAEG